MQIKMHIQNPIAFLFLYSTLHLKPKFSKHEYEKYPNYNIQVAPLFFIDDNTPLMLNISIHNVLQPLLHHSGIISTRTTSHWNIQFLITEVDCGNGGDEVLDESAHY